MCLSGTLSNQHVMALNHICHIYLPLCFLIPPPNRPSTSMSGPPLTDPTHKRKYNICLSEPGLFPLA